MLKFNEMVVFGDSLSDNGNLYLFMGELIPKSPPYFEGHFSNGPTWIEYIFSMYNKDWNPSIKPYSHPELFRNFAVGGAGALIAPKEELPYSLEMEIELYKYQHYFADKSQVLYTILIGANNYVKGPTNVDEITTNVINAIEDNIKKLIAIGASQFMIVNLPDMGKTPEAKANGISELLTQLSTVHNEKLAKMNDALIAANPYLKFIYIDLMSMSNDIHDNPANYNITNVTAPANNGGMIINPLDNLNVNDVLDYLDQAVVQKALRISTVLKNEISTNPIFGRPIYNTLASVTAVPDSPAAPGYLFWDGVHPTTEVHLILANKIKNGLDIAGVTYVGLYCDNRMLRV